HMLMLLCAGFCFFFFQAEDGIRDFHVTGVQTCALPIFLILWPQYLNGLEAVPNGGKRMSEIMNDILSDAMRIPSVGAIGECDFYGYASCRATSLGTGKGGSRNFLHSFTNIALVLSEARV